MFETAVVGVASDAAGRDALGLATELISPSAELTLVHVHVLATKPSSNAGLVTDAEKCRYAVERMTALAADFPIDARISCVEAASVRVGLHEFAADRRADLLVVGATHHDEYERTFVGDETREVLDGAPCAVGVAPAGYSSRGSRIEKIGVGYDGSHESERAVGLARVLAAGRSRELGAFDAIPEPIVIHDAWNVEGEVEQRAADARHRAAALGGVRAEVGVGEAVDELTAYAQSVDLLVIGSHRYRPTDRVLQRWSKAQRLADEAPSPLLVLGPAD